MSRSSIARPPLEVWGGLEPTINRVGDRYFDQIEQSGHAWRTGDLDRFAALGLRTLRYPVLWERTAPKGIAAADWSWPDERLTYLRALGIRPIVGLVHHGSGPPWTSLVDPRFGEHLAAYAAALAARFPWIEDYTPLNEPLTTARFSGLYGLWYPHGRDDATFCRALINQCRAIILAMRAVRSVNSAARLVQTEDLGKTHSTPPLAYQAAFENERRWLSWDLLCGRVDRHHPLWSYLTLAGVRETDLAWFLDNACPPDVLGVNYYLSGERFLDHRLERYPADSHGGNGKSRYADSPAARVLVRGQAGVHGLLCETWARYGRPIAITEAHNGCTREEQMRWLQDVWNATQAARRTGVDVRAVSVWALLGSFDWNTLVTQQSGYYEPGVFDVRSPEPRPTALAGMVSELAAGRYPHHPVLESPGWWRRPDRFQYPPVHSNGTCLSHPVGVRRKSRRTRPLLITGARGTLASAFARLCEQRGLPYILLDRQQLDIAKRASVQAAVERFSPWAVVNAAGYVRVDDAETDTATCFRENTSGPVVLADMCAAHDVRLLTFSTDLVFDGAQAELYTEQDRPAPLSVYGRSKALAEALVLIALPTALVVRTSAFFGPWDPHNIVTVGLAALEAGSTFRAANDAIVSPTYVPDLVHASLDLLIDGEHGIWHLANQGCVTWFQFIRTAAAIAKVESTRLEGCTTSALCLVAERPMNSALANGRGWVMPSLGDALERYVVERAEFDAEPEGHARRHQLTASALPLLLKALR